MILGDPNNVTRRDVAWLVAIGIAGMLFFGFWNLVRDLPWMSRVVIYWASFTTLGVVYIAVRHWKRDQTDEASRARLILNAFKVFGVFGFVMALLLLLPYWIPLILIGLALFVVWLIAWRQPEAEEEVG